MNLEISKIKLKRRIRKDTGDIKSLMDSLVKYGLINPVVVNSKYELLAGRRRLLAAKKLKWKTIDVKIVEATDKLDKLNIEMEENTSRKDFTPDELEKGLKLKAELERIKKMPLFARILYRIFRWILDFFSRIFKLE